MRRRLRSPDYRRRIRWILLNLLLSDIQAVVGPDKNKLATALLAIFLGTFGAHKFYLGGPNETKRGLVYLAFFWTAIPAIVGFIEGILFLLMPEEKFQERFAGA